MTSLIAQSVVDILGLNDLLAQLILAVGAAMILGNGYAIYQARQGKAPKGAEGQFRAGRAWWLLGVGTLITVWGIASLVT
jgi:hypothetical protein